MRPAGSNAGRCPGETTADVEREARALLGDLDGDVQVRFCREPLETSADEEIVQLLARHAGADEPIGVPFWTDAALLAEAGIPTVVFGPAGDGAHADVEWVDLASVERCYDVLLATVSTSADDATPWMVGVGGLVPP